MRLRRVVVTGLGALTPLGIDVPTYWDGLAAGRSGAAPITKFDAAKFRTRFACELKGLNVEDHIDKKEARKIDPFSHYAIISATEAMTDSGIDTTKVNLDRAGVIWGSGIGGLRTFIDEIM